MQKVLFRPTLFSLKSLKGPQPRNLLITFPQAGAKTIPILAAEDKEKLKTMAVEPFFEDYIRRKKPSKGGYIRMSREVFKNLVRKAQTEQEFSYLMDVYVNYVGHRNIMPQGYIENMVRKALERGYPETMFLLFDMHSELLYHPSDSIIEGYFNFYLERDWEVTQKFFQAISKERLLNLKGHHWRQMIEISFQNQDSAGVLDTYANILDYEEASLEWKHFEMVFECLSYSERIDHHLFEHLVEQAEKFFRQVEANYEYYGNLLMFKAVYFYKIKGFLTVVDLFNEIGEKGYQIQSYSRVKEELFDKLAEDVALDVEVKWQITKALRTFKEIDQEFYGIKEMIELEDFERLNQQEENLDQQEDGNENQEETQEEAEENLEHPSEEKQQEAEGEEK